MFQVNPSIELSTNIWRFTPYTRMGIIAGFGNVYRTYGNPYQNSTNGYIDEHTVWRYYGGTSIGYDAVLGVAYPLTRKFDLYTEACFNYIYDVPAYGQMTEQTINGVNNLNNDNTSQKDEIFRSSYNKNEKVNPNNPTNASQIKFSFSNVEANVGIRIWF
jgi:hypothetical protein